MWFVLFPPPFSSPGTPASQFAAFDNQADAIAYRDLLTSPPPPYGVPAYVVQIATTPVP